MAAQAAARVFDLALFWKVGVEFEAASHLVEPGIAARGMSNVVQQVLDRLERRLGSLQFMIDQTQADDRSFDLGQCLDDGRRWIDHPGRNRPCQPLDHPEQLAESVVHRQQAALGSPLGQLLGSHAALVRLGQHGQGFTDRTGNRTQTLLTHHQRQADHPLLHVRGQRPAHIRCKQRALGQADIPAHLAQVVDQRQQDQGNVAEAGLDAFQIIGQLDDAAHQHGEGFVAIADRTVDQGFGQPFHFRCNHRRAAQFEHAQRALHLMQVAGAIAHRAVVGLILEVVFERASGEPHDLVKLGLDPGQRGESDVVMKPHSGALKLDVRRAARHSG